MNSIKEINMLAAKMDLLVKRVEHYEKLSAQETLKAMDSHMTYEVVEMLDIQEISVPRPRRISTSSTPTTGFIHNNIKDAISAPTIRELTIITLLV
jgi:hypothetical protein